MIEIKDRLPLGNGKNNIVKPAGIPGSITTVADLIAFLNAGFYADVKANNALTGDNIGTSAIGTPQNKALLESIEEGMPFWPSSDVDIQTGSKTLTAGWTWVAFTRKFQFVPKIAAVANGDNTGLYIVKIKGAAVDGFYAAVVQPSNSSLTTTSGNTTDAAYVSGIGNHSHGITGGFISSVTMNASISAFVATNIDYVAVVNDNY